MYSNLRIASSESQSKDTEFTSEPESPHNFFQRPSNEIKMKCFLDSCGNFIKNRRIRLKGAPSSLSPNGTNL